MIGNNLNIWIQRFSSFLRTRIGNDQRTLEPLEAYQLWADTYDNQQDNALLYAEESAILPHLRSIDLTGKKILDAGCGSGRYIELMREFNPQSIDGIDISGKMIDRAKGKFENDTAISLRVSDIASMPYPDTSFDFILCTLALDHVPDLNKGIGELSRVLRSDGILITSVYHPIGKKLGWKRTFRCSTGTKQLYSVKYYNFTVDDYVAAFRSFHLNVEMIEEPLIDESIKPFFKNAGRIDIYNRFNGYPLLLIFRVNKK